MKYTLTALIGLTLLLSAQEPPAPGTTPPPAPGTKSPTATGTTSPSAPGTTSPSATGATPPSPTGTTPPAPGSPDASDPPNVPAPVPNIAPPSPGGAVGLAARAKVLDPNAIVVPEGAAIEKPNMTGLEAAQLYEDHTGKRVIMSSQASQAEVFFVQRGPLTNADIAKYLKAALIIEGLAILPDPLDPDMVRILPSGPSTTPSDAPIAYISDPLDLPTEDQLVTYKMFFDHLKPEEAEKIFQSAVGQLTPAGSITTVANASSLLIKANSALIHQMIKIKEDIDVASKIGEKWVNVVYADVDEISERLNEIYNEQGSNRSTTRSTRTNTPPAPGTAAIPGGGGAGEEIPIKIIPDNRTNRILLVGRPAELVAVEALVKSFDIQSSNKNSASFRLRYVRVGEFLQAAQDAITATMSDNTGTAGGAGGNRLPSQSTNTRTTNNTTNNNRTNNTTGAAGGGGSRTNIQSVDIPTAPESVLIGKTHLVGDNLSNTIIINGPPHHIEIVRNLVADLDTETQQVALSAVVGSYSLADNHNFGVDLARLLSDSGASFAAGGSTSFGVPSVVDPTTLDQWSNLLGARGGEGQGVSLYGQFGDDFAVFVNALESETNFKTLNRTILVTKNNRVANLSSGQRIAVPSSSFAGGGVNGTTTNVEYRDVVLELEIQPLINSDNEITLEISLVKDDVGTDRRISADLSVPDISTEELTTSVTVRDGSAVLLGGLITEKETEGSSGFPVLRRIPGLGRLFGNTEEGSERSELVILIRPQIIPTSTEMDEFRQRYQNYSENTNDAMGMFPQSLLPQDGTMPPAPPVGSSKSSVAPAAATPPPANTSDKKESKIRGKKGRP